MQAITKLFVFILAALFPDTVKSLSEKFSVFRTYVLTLPTITDSVEFRVYVWNSFANLPGWNLITLTQPVLEDLFIQGLNETMQAGDDFVIYRVEKSGILDTNYARIVKIILRKTESQLELIIASTFEQAQLVERGKLEAVNNQALEIVKQYFASKQIDIASNLREMQIFKDSVSKRDKKVNPVIATIVIALFIAGIIWVFTHLIELTYRFLM